MGKNHPSLEVICFIVQCLLWAFYYCSAPNPMSLGPAKEWEDRDREGGGEGLGRYEYYLEKWILVLEYHPSSLTKTYNYT